MNCSNQRLENDKMDVFDKTFLIGLKCNQCNFLCVWFKIDDFELAE